MTRIVVTTRSVDRHGRDLRAEEAARPARTDAEQHPTEPARRVRPTTKPAIATPGEDDGRDQARDDEQRPVRTDVEQDLLVLVRGSRLGNGTALLIAVEAPQTDSSQPSFAAMLPALRSTDPSAPATENVMRRPLERLGDEVLEQLAEAHAAGR